MDKRTIFDDLKKDILDGKIGVGSGLVGESLNESSRNKLYMAYEIDSDGVRKLNNMLGVDFSFDVAIGFCEKQSNLHNDNFSSEDIRQLRKFKRTTSHDGLYQFVIEEVDFGDFLGR